MVLTMRCGEKAQILQLGEKRIHSSQELENLGDIRKLKQTQRQISLTKLRMITIEKIINITEGLITASSITLSKELTSKYIT